MTDYFEKNSAAFDKELTKQADLLWPREVERLEEHGLARAKRVLDLGTGNGYFLHRLAKRHPKKSFTGLEASPSLCAVARRWKARNLTIVQRSCPTKSLEGPFDLVLARLALYTMPNRAAVLRWARGLLSPNGRIVIDDVDDGFKVCSPPSPLWKMVVGAMTKEIGPTADRRIGHKLPALLRKAGFGGVRFEVQPWLSSFDLGPKSFADFWGGAARQMAEADPKVFGRGGLKKVLKAVREFERSPEKVALCCACVVSARR